jgi:hypothetical protein
MSLTLASTTEPQTHLDAAVSDDWRTPPAAQAEPKENSNGDSKPIDKLDPETFAKVRAEQIKARKEAEWEFRMGEEGGGQSKSKFQKRIDKVTRNWRESEKLREAAERRAAELEARLNGAAPKQETTEPVAATQETRTEAPQPPPTEPQKVEYNRKFAEAAKRYPDFKETIDAADRSGVQISESLESVIRATGNAGDVAYFLAKNPKLISELEKDHTRVAQISKDLRAATIDRESELMNAHADRLRKAFPDLSKLRKLHTDALASGVGTTAAINSAVLEQPNSEQVAVHLLQNHELRAELSRLSPAAAMARVGRIAEQLESRANGNGNREKPKPPEPIAPVGGSATRGSVNLDELSPTEYIRVRNKQERERRR